MATTYAVQKVSRAVARAMHRKGLLWLLGAVGVALQLFYFALGPLARLGNKPLALRYPAADQAGFAVGPHGETAIASSFYGQVQVYDEAGKVRGVLPLPLPSDGAPVAFDDQGNLYACTENGVEAFDPQLRRLGRFSDDDRRRPGIWRLCTPGTLEFHPFDCPSREALKASRPALARGSALFLVEEKADRIVKRPVGASARCETSEGSEATWNPWLARVEFRAQDGSSWSVGTPWYLLPFTVIWPGILWWGVAAGLCWTAIPRKAKAVDPRAERRRQLV